MSKQVIAPKWENMEYYRDLVLLTIPLLCMSCYFYGARPLLVCLAALLTGNLCDRLISLLRRRPYKGADLSSESFALVIALLMPPSVDYQVVVVAALAGVLLGKEAFGGYGSYPFQPAAVGYAVAAVSWGDQVFRYPQPGVILPLGSCAGVALSESGSSMLKNGGVPNLSLLNMVLGNQAGAIGCTALLVIVACGLVLLARRDIHLDAPLVFLLVSFGLCFLFPRAGDLSLVTGEEAIRLRVTVAGYEVLTGGSLFAAFFLLNEPFTCPRNRVGRVLYAFVVAVFTILFRYYGVYETGCCFALLTAGSISGWLDRMSAGINARFVPRGGNAG